MANLYKEPPRSYGNPNPASPPEGRELPQTLAGAADPVRLAELERENSRLHRLIAELLIKNQQLRKSD